MDVGTGGHKGHVLSLFKVSGKVPSSCNLVALLEDSDGPKITSKIHVSSDFRGRKFQNFTGEYDPRAPSYITCKNWPVFIIQRVLSCH